MPPMRVKPMLLAKAVGAAALLVTAWPGAGTEESGRWATAAQPAAQVANHEQALLERITELSVDPERTMWMTGDAYRGLVLERRRELVAKINKLLSAFPKTAARERVLEYKMESLFAISMVAEKPPTALKELVEKVLAEQPGRSLEGTASFWQTQVAIIEKARAGATGQELNKFQMEQYARLARDYPDNEKFGDEVLANLAQVHLMEGRMDRAKEYYGLLKKYHPDSQMIQALAGEFWKRDALSRPFEMAFTDVNGKAVDVSKMKGKVILVDFWATWCVPCVMAMPEVKRVYRKHHDKGLEIIGINLDTKRMEMDRFIRKHQLPWPQYFDGKGWNSPMAMRYRVAGIPAMFLVDKKGILRSMDVSGSLERDVARLLAE